MAVRHRVENLIRRGNIYYWRARIPSAFRLIAHDQRLSISLRLSDYDKASLIARHLNTFLATLAKTLSITMTTTKDQLTSLCLVERDEKLTALCNSERREMTRILDDAVMNDRRAGLACEDVEIAHALLCAWSCRLMELFGPHRKVRFDEACPARSYLISEGFTHPRAIRAIQYAFEDAQKAHNSERFDGKMAFVLHKMGLEDTPANRERARIAHFRGWADAMMNVEARYGLPHENAADVLARGMRHFEDHEAGQPSDPLSQEDADDSETSGAPTEFHCACCTTNRLNYQPRSPQSDGLSSPSNSTTPPGQADDTSLPPPFAFGSMISIQASYGVGGNGSAGSSSLETALWKDPNFSPPIQAEARSEPDVWDPNFFDDANNDIKLHGGEFAPDVLPVSEFASFADQIVIDKGAHWEKETATDFKAAVKVLASVLIEHGVTHSGNMTQRHLGFFRNHLNDIPTHWGKSPRMRQLSAPELREEAKVQRDAYEKKVAAGKSVKEPLKGLCANTIRKHFGNLKHFLEGAHGKGYRLQRLTFRGLRPPKPRAGSIRYLTKKVGPDDLGPVFRSPLYTGCQAYMGDGRLTQGGEVFHDSLYWLPMLYIYLGARRAELAYLMTEDIENHPVKGWTVHIRPNKYRRLKNLQSQRSMPLPDEVIRLGFPDYLKAIKATGSDLLFPDLCNPTLTNNLGDAFYRDYQALLFAILDEKRWDRAIHAMRHGFADMLHEAGVSPEQIDGLCGRMGETETSRRYTNRQSIDLQRKLLAHLPNLTAHLQPRPIRLAPWVEDGGVRPTRGRMPRAAELVIWDDISDSDPFESDSASNAVL